MENISIDDLLELTNKLRDSGVYSLGGQDGLKIKSINRNTEYIMVSFSGAIVGRKQKNPPFFSFENVSKHLNISLIAFSDPTVDMGEECSLAWYIGNEKMPQLHSVIANICDLVIRQTGKKIILVGGSGGGYAALSVHQLMDDFANSVAYVWNPQTNIVNYSLSHVERFLAQAYKSENYTYSKSKDKVLNFLDAKKIRYKFSRKVKKKTVIHVDGYDSPHIRMHLKDYFNDEALIEQSCNNFLYENALVHLGCWGAGHTPPPKDLILKTIDNIVSEVEFCSFDAYGVNECPIPVLDLKKHEELLVESLDVSFKQAGEILLCRLNLPRLFIGYSLVIHCYEIRGGQEVKVGNTGFISKTANEDVFFNVSGLNGLDHVFFRVHVFDFFHSKISLRFSLAGKVQKNNLISLK